MIHVNRHCFETESSRPGKVPKKTLRTEPEKWVLNKIFLDQTIVIGPAVSEIVRTFLKQLLTKNVDIFAWQPADMTGVPHSIAEHKLRVNPMFTPDVQKKRKMGPEQTKAMNEQVQDLLHAGIIRESKFQTWVANPVIVPKSNGTWLMCIDFKDLNKACPKDCYPLSEIDIKVDAVAPFKFKCFLDAYKGYHQILMAAEDEDKTAFRTGQGTFCYKMMPFGLKNAGATYQRLIDQAFKDQIGRNLEVYMDDLVIKSIKEDQMLRDIEETFKTLRSVNMKLNPAKCSFGMEEGKFLGAHFKWTTEGEQAFSEVKKCLMELPTLTAPYAGEPLTLYLSASDIAVGAAHFKWTTEGEQAFSEVKKCLMELLTLTAPYAGEPLTLYLSASDIAVGADLSDPETRYSMFEKLVLALVYASRRLRRYFQGHPINVLTGYKLKNVLSKPELSGRLAKWAIELGEHAIEYKPRPAIKGQVLADFVTEVPQHKEKEFLMEQQPQAPPEQGQAWSLFTDEASSSEGSGAGLRLAKPEGHEFTYSIKLNFKSTNNEAEYEAFLAGLWIAKKLGVKYLEARVDSMLIEGQINGTYEAKNDVMVSYLSQENDLIRQFSSFNIIHIKRSENKSADALSKLASTNFEHFAKDIRVKVLDHPSVSQNQVLVIQTGVESWMTPIKAYLSSGALPAQKAEDRKIKHKALNYQLNDGVLYRRSFLGPLLHCVDAEDANYLIREIHEGICGLHAGPRMTVAKIMNAGCYWAGMHLDAVQEIRKCDSCQRHAPNTLRPKNELIPVTSAWPFQKWAIDLGPFPEALG
ncbi:uncharacterized protein LOC143541309 [Bidens hawaiensis]|uniref:uncharacterized protein LOC143541309 n=1 Tax=Bidens hawaiensis TaxID=980011 RepID=UPI0040499956